MEHLLKEGRGEGEKYTQIIFNFFPISKKWKIVAVTAAVEHELIFFHAQSSWTAEQTGHGLHPLKVILRPELWQL